MREFGSEGPRSSGPSVVWAGRDDGPALVVLDPSGAPLPDDPPATWHSLAGRFQVAWCRLPASQRAAEDIEDVLETLAERQPPVYVVSTRRTRWSDRRPATGDRRRGAGGRP